jgi:hypothetical protein
MTGVRCLWMQYPLLLGLALLLGKLSPNSLFMYTLISKCKLYFPLLLSSFLFFSPFTLSFSYTLSPAVFLVYLPTISTLPLPIFTLPPPLHASPAIFSSCAHGLVIVGPLGICSCSNSSQQLNCASIGLVQLPASLQECSNLTFA